MWPGSFPVAMMFTFTGGSKLLWRSVEPVTLHGETELITLLTDSYVVETINVNLSSSDPRVTSSMEYYTRNKLRQQGKAGKTTSIALTFP